MVSIAVVDFKNMAGTLNHTNTVQCFLTSKALYVVTVFNFLYGAH